MASFYYKCFAILISVLAGISAQKRYHDTTRVMDELLKKENYDKRLRPFFQEKPLQISLHITVENFEKLDEKEMTFGITLFLVEFWHDERLKHRLPYPITLTGEARNLVWLPDTFILNLKSATFHKVPTDNGVVKIFPTGNVKSNARLALDVNCDMELRDYPLDDQTCNITMLSYSHRSWEVDYKWGSPPHVRLLETSLSEFELLRFKTNKQFFNYTSGTYTHMTASFSFKRRIGYALLQIYAPTMLIVALSWLSFWVSKDAVPARITLGVTTILTIVTLVGSFRSQVPKVSYIKAIDVFFIVSFMFVFGAQMEFISVLLHSGVKDLQRKNKSEDPEETMPLQTINCDGEGNRHPDPSSNAVHKRKAFKAHQSSSRYRKVIAMALKHPNTDVIDRIARILFPVAYALFLVSYFLYFQLTESRSKATEPVLH